MEQQFKWPEPIKKTAFPIASPGYPVIYAMAFMTLILALLKLPVMALLTMGFTLFVCYFFRDPDRVVPTQEGAIVSPADGKVILAEHLAGSPFMEGPCYKISIFMSVFNVHVNRIPYNGTVREIIYSPGKFVNASFDKASEDNERNAVIVETDDGIRYATVQIAGLIARRIICGITEGEKVIKGTRYGMICFGSRLDVYLPVDVKLNVSKGEKVYAGKTILGHLHA